MEALPLRLQRVTRDFHVVTSKSASKMFSKKLLESLGVWTGGHAGSDGEPEDKNPMLTRIGA